MKKYLIIIILFYSLFPADASGGLLENSSDTCWLSIDGTSVSCGGQSSICRQNSDWTSVSCGGQSSACWESSDGSDVSCGGFDQ